MKVQGCIVPWLSLSARMCQTAAPANRLKILDSNEGSVVRQWEITIVNNGKVVELWGRHLSERESGLVFSSPLHTASACSCEVQS